MSESILHDRDRPSGDPAAVAKDVNDETCLATLSGQRQDSVMIEERLAKLEGIVEGFRSFPPLALTALSIVMAAMGVVLTIGIFSINGMRGEIKDLGTRTESQIKELGARTDSQIKELGARTDSQIKDLGVRMDGISKQLSEEFRAMRAETAAQTSAIANSITAARQFQPQGVVAPPAPEPPRDQKPRR